MSTTVSIHWQEKCRNRTTRIARSTTYLIHEDGRHVTRLTYKTILDCLRNIVNFWSRTTLNYNEVNAKLKSTENIIIVLKME